MMLPINTDLLRHLPDSHRLPSASERQAATLQQNRAAPTWAARLARFLRWQPQTAKAR